MTSAIVPEILDVEILENSAMTRAEQEELIALETEISAAYADRLHQDLAIGKALTQIFRRRLYRGETGGQKWETWLEKKSAKFTNGRGALGKNAALYLRGFYQFRCEVLQEVGTCPPDIVLPASPAQIRPLLGQLETHPETAVEMWKAACADAAREKVGKVPSYEQVQRAALAFKANAENAARRVTPAREEINRRATEISSQVRAERAAEPEPQPATEPSVPGWTLQKDDGALDAIEECKEITRAINKAHEAVGLLRGILYKRISVHGRDYMGFLRQVDAGVYSLSTIDHEVRQIGEDVDFVLALLVADVGEGELSQTTVDLSAIPTRET
jgi:hypothetical protein